MPGGRPTIYDPAFCDRVIQMGREGYSRAQMASELEVSKFSLQEWEKVHPEFSVALTRAMTHAQAWWERKGQENLVESPMGNRINPGLYSRSMAARFPDDWREKTATELSGPNGSPIATDNAFRVEFVAPSPRPSEG